MAGDRRFLVTGKFRWEPFARSAGNWESPYHRRTVDARKLLAAGVSLRTSGRDPVILPRSGRTVLHRPGRSASARGCERGGDVRRRGLAGTGGARAPGAPARAVAVVGVRARVAQADPL